MTRKSSNLKGGNANTFPIEYYGGNSGRYTADAGSNSEHAYGNTVAQSYGEPFSDHSTGPNLHVIPGGSNQQTGGGNRRKSCGNKLRRNSRRRRSARSTRSTRSRNRRRSTRNRRRTSRSRGRRVNKKRTQRRR